MADANRQIVLDRLPQAARARRIENGRPMRGVVSRPELVVEAGSLEIKVNGHHAFAKRGQKPRGIGKEKGAPHAALVRIERNRFHNTYAAKPKGPVSRKRRARSLASCGL